MAVSIVPGSVTLSVTSRPTVLPPSVSGTNLSFKSTSISFSGACRLTGSAGDNPAGWTLGLIQLKWISTDWAYYVGQSNGDGSSFLQMARPPARPVQGCRDTITPGAIFIDNNPGLDRTVALAGAPFPIAMSAAFSDAPSRVFALSRRNRRTGKVNFIREAQSEAHFCTVLSLMSPAGVFSHLKCIYWNVHWQSRSVPTNFANMAAPWSITRTVGGNAANVGKIIDGTPTDPRFAPIITIAAAPHCNTLVRAAIKSPNVRESSKWENFDVTK